MRLEVGLQQIRFDLYWVDDECALKYEVAARKQVFDLGANDFFEPARVEESARPAIPWTDSLLPRALATTGLTDIYDVRAPLNSWYYLRSPDYIHAMSARNRGIGSLKALKVAGWIAPAYPLQPSALLLELVHLLARKVHLSAGYSAGIVGHPEFQKTCRASLGVASWSVKGGYR